MILQSVGPAYLSASKNIVMDEFEKADAMMKRWNDTFAYEHLPESFHAMGKRYRALAAMIAMEHAYAPGEHRDKALELLLQSQKAAQESQKATDEPD